MNPEKKIEPEKIQIVNIRTIKGNIEAPTDVNMEVIAGHKFNFEAELGFNKAEKLVGIQLMVYIDAMDKGGSLLNITGSYTHEVVFRVDNIDDFVQLDTDEKAREIFQIDELMGSTLMSITYSTVRGIIYSRTQGTSLGMVILPVIDPKKLLEVAGGK